MQNLFVNIKNEKTYSIVGFVRRKNPITKQWETEIAYSPDGSPQLYARTVVEFFSKFVPHNCWATATEEQKDAMRGGIVPIVPIAIDEAKADYRPIPRSGDGLEDGRY